MRSLKKEGDNIKTELTLKQEKYVQELIKGHSQRQAYKKVYSCKNMTNKSIDEKASRLFNQVKVRSRYKELKNKVINKSEEEAILQATDIIKELKEIAFNDIGNYIDFKTVKSVVGYENGEPIFDYRPVIELKDSKDIETSTISEVSISNKGEFKFKMYNKLSALSKLADILGLNETNKEKLRLEVAKFEESKRVNSTKYW